MRSISDYCFHLVHTEEKELIVNNTTKVYNPHTVTKDERNTNEKDNIFFGNLICHIELQSLLMPGSKYDMIRLLKIRQVTWYILLC